MADIVSGSKRSWIMSQVRHTNTTPEKKVCSFLFKEGFRFRKNVANLPGSPDIVLKKYGTVIFVNGCFWHGHTKCQQNKLPKSNTIFWKTKIERNVSRDMKSYKLLRKMGWSVVVIWECDLRKNLKSLLKLKQKLLGA